MKNLVVLILFILPVGLSAQHYDDASSGAAEFYLAITIGLAFIVVVVLLMRLLGAWMLRINDVIRLQNTQLDILTNIYKQMKNETKEVHKSEMKNETKEVHKSEKKETSKKKNISNLFFKEDEF